MTDAFDKYLTCHVRHVLVLFFNHKNWSHQNRLTDISSEISLAELLRNCTKIFINLIQSNYTYVT